ncbi:MAG: N-6 DNA methylase [Cyanobacteria bacterium]|nr:N-6 DNA methylase [Cyanobacteriota bacterium]
MVLVNPAGLFAFSEAATVFKGHEKSEAATFLNRFFAAFGYQDAIAAGAVFEEPIAKGSAKGNTGFADLVWRSSQKPPRPGVLFEMKTRGENLEKHRRQAFAYWERLVPNRPRYVVLCNFDEFWIYDFDTQIDEPVDRIGLAQLGQRASAFTFMVPGDARPVFNNNQQEITILAARRMGEFYGDLVKRLGRKFNDIEPLQVQRFVLQCVLAMFAEDRGLLPNDIFTQCVIDCLEGESSSDLIGGLFLRMNQRGKTREGRFKGVDYFNGGLFSEVLEFNLETTELEILRETARQDWNKIRPAIFGNIFEGTADSKERHAYGIHFTSEIDILKIVRPTISQDWEERIESAKSLNELEQLRQALSQYRVLDPACGSGNFLYVAYQEMKDLEKIILDRIAEYGQQETPNSDQTSISLVTPAQFFGIDMNPFAIQLAQVTLTIARKVAIDRLNLDESALPLDTLDQNIVRKNALLNPWPAADVIIGNPPFLGGKHMRLNLGDRYVNKIFFRFPEVKDSVDYCAYWFRLAHNHLPDGARAGLVATNSIAQGKSRIASLDYISRNGGVIHDAVSTQPWSGEANVHVSIVNWIKNPSQPPKKLVLDEQVVESINTTLKSTLDVTIAERLNANLNWCFQGVIPIGRGFVVSEEQVEDWIAKNPKNAEVLKLFSMGSNLAKNLYGKPERWIIDFNDLSLDEASQYSEPFNHVKKNVKPVRDLNRRDVTRQNWWKYGEKRPAMRKALEPLSFYIAVPEVSKWSTFIICDRNWLPGNKVKAVASDDLYVLGILLASVHRSWIDVQKSTLKADTAYTHNTCFETFPFPQKPSKKVIADIRQITQELHDYRTRIMDQNQWGITKLYNEFFHEPASGLAKLHKKLDRAALKAYGFAADDDILEKLLTLNLELAEQEQQGTAIIGPWAPDRPPSHQQATP